MQPYIAYYMPRCLVRHTFMTVSMVIDTHTHIHKLTIIHNIVPCMCMLKVLTSGLCSLIYPLQDFTCQLMSNDFITQLATTEWHQQADYFTDAYVIEEEAMP